MRSELRFRSNATAFARHDAQCRLSVSLGWPHAMQRPDSARLDRLAFIAALALTRHALQSCDFVSFGPPHSMQDPDAPRLALLARADAFT